ncbi:MAG: Abi family protein [Candidatus Kapabacteria bacterium]|nr:Abi family protein [Candidatus Kapabacteria bacterium]
MTKHPFLKPALSIPEQLELLRHRGMHIDDVHRAEFVLRHTNYYRLAAYWLPFESDSATHKFRAATTFEDVLSLYAFDRELRLLVLDAIERIEVSLRAIWAHTLAMEHGPHAHMNVNIMKDERRWRRFIATTMNEVDRSTEVFIQHLLRKHSEMLPPIWAVSEVMSMGSLSKWYENIGPKHIRTAIAAEYGLNEILLESWCKHLSYVRNICAHHGRLWNREFMITPAKPRTRPQNIIQAFQPSSRRVYNTFVILLYFMDRIAPEYDWRNALTELLVRCAPDLKPMGFPADWCEHKIWK